jgi:hypothetical protein
MRNACGVLVGNPTGENLLKRTNGSFADYIKKSLREID